MNGVRANTFPQPMLSLALQVVQHDTSTPADRVAVLWACARTHPARLHDPHRSHVVDALCDVARLIQAMPTVIPTMLAACPLHT